MAEWKNEVLNWAEEHSDGQRELKVWRELITEYLEEEYLKEDGMSDEEFKQFLIEQESWETMAEDYMEATGYSLYDRDGNIVISDAILEYYEAFKGSQISLTQFGNSKENNHCCSLNSSVILIYTFVNDAKASSLRQLD